MKLVYCEACGDILAPHRKPRQARSCNCGRHTFWWTDIPGNLEIHDRERQVDADGDAIVGWRPKAFVLGIHNQWLLHPLAPTPMLETQAICAAAEGYLFQTYGCPVVRLRPGYSRDTKWVQEVPA